MNRIFHQAAYEKAIEDTVTGMGMFARDVNLPAKIAQKYEPGRIILERAFTDASVRVAGMVTTHRFLILSNHMANFAEFEHGTNWGLYVAKNDARFLILDVYTYAGKTQILLLHLPDDERWAYFYHLAEAGKNVMIEDCRKSFEQMTGEEALSELTGVDWLERCEFPLGIDDEGNYFEL